MDSKTCCKCGQEFPSSSMMRLDSQTYCSVCGEQVLTDMRSEEATRQSTASSVCAVCGMNGGTVRNGGSTPICDDCAPKVYERDFPQWLKGGMIVALLLLVVALAHGAKYFNAGRNLYRGEKLTNAGKPEQAVEILKPVVALAPECQKCILLLSKAELLAGDPDSAYDLVEGRSFDSDKDLIDDVKRIFTRVDGAVKLVNTSIELVKQDKEEEALKNLRDAKRLYPEWKLIGVLERDAGAGVAFIKKDYDRFLELERTAAAEHPEDAYSQAALASALACKYAVTGEESFRKEAESSLQIAAMLAGNDPKQHDQFNEYSERIQHRLRTREIITKNEYDRRFHPERLNKEEK